MELAKIKLQIQGEGIKYGAVYSKEYKSERAAWTVHRSETQNNRLLLPEANIASCIAGLLVRTTY